MSMAWKRKKLAVQKDACVVSWVTCPLTIASSNASDSAPWRHGSSKSAIPFGTAPHGCSSSVELKPASMYNASVSSSAMPTNSQMRHCSSSGEKTLAEIMSNKVNNVHGRNIVDRVISRLRQRRVSCVITIIVTYSIEKYGITLHCQCFKSYIEFLIWQ